jgi:hypothetical protein
MLLSILEELDASACRLIPHSTPISSQSVQPQDFFPQFLIFGGCGKLL